MLRPLCSALLLQLVDKGALSFFELVKPIFDSFCKRCELQLLKSAWGAPNTLRAFRLKRVPVPGYTKETVEKGKNNTKLGARNKAGTRANAYRRKDSLRASVRLILTPLNLLGPAIISPPCHGPGYFFFASRWSCLDGRNPILAHNSWQTYSPKTQIHTGACTPEKISASSWRPRQSQATTNTCESGNTLLSTGSLTSACPKWRATSKAVSPAPSFLNKSISGRLTRYSTACNFPQYAA